MIKRHSANPLIEPKSVKPSREGYRVKGAFNAGAAEYHDEIILLLRVAEDCVAGEGSVAVPYYRFDSGGGHAEILEVRADDPDVRLKDTRGVVYKGADYLSTLSHIRLARSKDGVTFTVDEKPFIYPISPSESFGAEDARVTKIDDVYYITYTAVSGDGWATALALTRDFQAVERKGIIFPPPNKDVSLFPEKVNGKYCALHRPHNEGFGKPSIWYSESTDLLHWGNHKCLIRPRDTIWEEQKIGGGAAPIKTDRGWLEIYHGKGKDQLYSLFLLLLDLKDPSKVLKRGEEPILIPKEPYETEGFFPNVVFSNGVITKADGSIKIYYGACDETVCLAETSVDELLSML
jgi:beta-1,2-mannobiose phosphorylase / 1,2-beta-oligomannan phosphorylase